MFNPSPYQARVQDFVVNGQGSAVVVAVAGSGKTKTIERCLPLIPENRSVLMLAFNKDIVKELDSRIALLRTEFGRHFANVKAQTFHSLGLRMVSSFLFGKKIKVTTDGQKIRTMLKANLSAEKYEMYGDFCFDLIGYAKAAGVGHLCEDTTETWQGFIDHNDLVLESDEASLDFAMIVARECLADSTHVALTQGFLDFNDMLYLPLIWKLSPREQHDWVFGDEQQDTSPVRRALMKLALKAGGRLLAVGDPKQAIYGFTGATHDAIDQIKHEFNCIELPLTISYRCPKSVGRLAQAIVPYFEVHEDAIEGKVSNFTYKQALPLLTGKDAILCRNTKPLVSLAYTLLADGIPCHVLGSEIGRGLIKLIQQMRAKNLAGLEDKLNAYMTREVAKFMSQGKEGRAEAIADKVGCVLFFVSSLDENSRTIARLIARIEALFSDATDKLTLSTIHKSKGKEWKTVVILDRELMPSKYARQDWQMEQEKCLEYVAVTRAQEHLIFMSSPTEAKDHA